MDRAVLVNSEQTVPVIGARGGGKHALREESQEILVALSNSGET